MPSSLYGDEEQSQKREYEVNDMNDTKQKSQRVYLYLYAFLPNLSLVYLPIFKSFSLVFVNRCNTGFVSQGNVASY